MSGLIAKEKAKRITLPRTNSGTGVKPRSTAEDEFGYSAPCPVCDKRALDITALPGIAVRVRLKCPHCHKLVKIPLGRAPPSER